MYRKLATLCAFVLLQWSVPLQARQTTQPSSKPHSYFISLDGLNPKHLHELLSKGLLTEPKGFKYLAKHLSHIEQLIPAYSTITAASHISTITCTPPGVHGVIANSFIRDGRKISGFSAPFQGEPLWQVLRKHNFKVLSIAYVGSNGTAPNRTADYGLAYPEDKLVSAPSSHKILKSDTKTYHPIPIVLNPQTGESHTLYIKLHHSKLGITASVDLDQNPDNGILGELHRKGDQANFVRYYVTEQDKKSVTYGYKRHVFLRILANDKDHLVIYQSGAAYNYAYPDAFRRKLDDAGLVWPNYAIRSEVTPQEKVAFHQQLDEFLAKVTVFAQQEYKPDTTLFYQPLLDTMGHSYESSLPPTLLGKDNQPASSLAQTFIEAYQVVDRNLNQILSQVKAGDVVALMGDHGMQPVTHTVNPLAFLPKGAWTHIDLVANGAMLLLYAKEGHAKQADQIGQQLYAAMKKETFQGQSILGTAHRKKGLKHYLEHTTGKVPEIFKHQWQFGDAVWAYTAAPNLWYVESLEDSQPIVPSLAKGMHGHFVGLRSMATTGYVGKIGDKVKSINRADLIDIVPTFLNLLHLKPSATCQGKVLKL